VVGLVPESALVAAAEHGLQLEGFSRDQVLEQRLRTPPLTEAVPVATFFEQVAGPTPTPGGGTVAAFTGALATCLATMVANLTIGKKKYAASEAAMAGIKRDAEALRAELLGLGRRDAEAFDAVLKARRLPQATGDEQAARAAAIAAADLQAARVPLETLRACTRVVALAGAAARQGNTNAVTDAGVAGLLAQAAGEGAGLNVEINLKSLPEGADKTAVAADLDSARAALLAAGGQCRDAVRAGMSA
jgi:glutamate formiminotransferase/formiminotetrahydrofolate cyclodeaminase